MKLAPDDVQLLRQLHPDAHARSSQPTWEIAGDMGTEVRSTEQRLHKLEHRGFLSCTWRSGVRWWRLSQRGLEAVEIALASEAQSRAATAASAGSGPGGANV